MLYNLMYRFRLRHNFRFLVFGFCVLCILLAVRCLLIISRSLLELLARCPYHRQTQHHLIHQRMQCMKVQFISINFFISRSLLTFLV